MFTYIWLITLCAESISLLSQLSTSAQFSLCPSRDLTSVHVEIQWMMVATWFFSIHFFREKHQFIWQWEDAFTTHGINEKWYSNMRMLFWCLFLFHIQLVKNKSTQNRIEWGEYNKAILPRNRCMEYKSNNLQGAKVTGFCISYSNTNRQTMPYICYDFHKSFLIFPRKVEVRKIKIRQKVDTQR